MALEANTVSRFSAGRMQLRMPRLLLVAFVLALPLVPLIAASPANLTSDESLYFAEAYNIGHGHGLTYPSGEAITHRAPLQPVLLAPAVRLAGADGAYAVSKLIVIANVALVALLAWRLAGGVAAAIAAVAAASSSFLNGLGATLYVDPLQCAFLLLSLTAIAHGARAQGARGRPVLWMATAGAMSGLAFLVKESAVQWLPLGVVAALMLPSLRARAGTAGAVAYTAVMLIVIAPWFAWVWWHTREIYLVGEVHPLALTLVLGAALGAGALALAARSKRVGDFAAGAARWAVPVGVALIAVHGALMLYALTAFSTWPYPNDYVRTVPEYLRTVAPEAQPYFLLVAAWGVTAWRAPRDEGSRLLLVAVTLYAPFALFAANRGLQLRDALPIVYLSFVGLGVAGAWTIDRAGEFISERPARVALAALAGIAAVMFGVTQAIDFRADNATASSAGVRYDSWDSVYVRESAAWMTDNLPHGSRVLSSRLYFSSLYLHTEGRFEVRQLPTIRVDVDPARDGLLRPAALLFRWGDRERIDQKAAGEWLYLKQFPGKGYWVALSERDLLAYIDAHQIDHIVLTGDDVAFSSLQLAPYLSSHPAFTLLHHDAATASDQLFVYAVDRSKLAATGPALTITPYDYATLLAATGLSEEQLPEQLGQPLRVADGNFGLSEPELRLALDGMEADDTGN